MADKQNRIYLILFGAQGSGKGTQARLLQERLGVPQVATGDLFRANLGQGTELGQLAKSYMDRGELVPDSVTVAMVEDRLRQPDAAKGAILDGFPRNLAQAQALDEMLAGWEAGITAAIYIELDRDQLIRRITGRRTCQNCQAVYHVEFNPPKVPGVCDVCGGPLVQRADDADEAAVARRLELYFDQTTPVIDYYAEKGLLKKVNGSGSIDEVQSGILTALENPARRPTAGKKQTRRQAAGKKSVAASKKTAKKAAAKTAKKAPTRSTRKAAAKKPAAKQVTRRRRA